MPTRYEVRVSLALAEQGMARRAPRALPVAPAPLPLSEAARAQYLADLRTASRDAR